MSKNKSAIYSSSYRESLANKSVMTMTANGVSLSL